MRDAALVAVIALLARLPFAAGTLWAWDSVLYARALELGFHIGADPFDQRPHPPGYILYLALANALRFVTGDSNRALVAVSMIAGALACGVAVLLAARIAGRRAGLVAGAVAIANPVLWHASEIAYPYALLALVTGGLALAFVAARTPRAIILASVAFGLALGTRQDILALLGPLWIVMLLASRTGWRTRAIATLAAGATALVWFVPSALAAGGIASYLGLVVNQAVGSSEVGAAGGPPFSRNLALTATGLWWQLLWLWPLAAVGAWRLACVAETRAIAARLVVAILPALALYTLFHIGEFGYTLSLAVLLAALVGVGADALSRVLPRRLAMLPLGAATLAAVVLAATFVVGSGRFSAAAISRHDEILQAQVAYIRARLPAADTVVLGQANYWHARYYLPEYRAVYLPGQARGTHVYARLGRASFAVFLDDHWRRFPKLPTTRVTLPRDIDLFYARVPGSGLTLIATEDELDLTIE